MLKVGICMVVILLIIAMVFLRNKEQFKSKEEKSSAIISWFENNKEPTYTDYKKLGGSNLVEYDAALRLSQSGKLTNDNLQNYIL
jgi:hypothetical protein